MIRQYTGVLWLRLICLLLLLGACTRPQTSPDVTITATAPAPPTPNAALYDLDPRLISAQLTSTGSLRQSAEQLAAAAAVPVDAIRILMRTETCVSCGAADGDQRALPELTIAEAMPLLVEGDSFWLNVPPLACLYALDSAQIKPQGCRLQ